MSFEFIYLDTTLPAIDIFVSSIISRCSPIAGVVTDELYSKFIIWSKGYDGIRIPHSHI